MVVYDWSIIEKRIDSILNRDMVPMFSLRLCPQPKILRKMVQKGVGLVCVNEQELLLARKVGCSEDMIWLDRIAPDRDLMTSAAAVGARSSCIEYVHYKDLRNLGAKRFMFRYLPDLLSFRTSKPYQMLRRLNIRSQMISLVSNELEKGMNIVLEALVGAADSKATPWSDALKRLEQGGYFARRVEPSILDGLCIHAAGIQEEQSTLNQLDKIVQERNQSDYKYKLYFRCGKYLIEDAGCTLAKITYIRLGVPDTLFLDVNMGIMPRLALQKAAHTFTMVEEKDEHYGLYEILGDVPDRQEIYCPEVYLRGPKRGDLIRITSTGAYNASTYSGEINKLPYSVVLVDGERVAPVYDKVTRKKKTTITPIQMEPTNSPSTKRRKK